MSLFGAQTDEERDEQIKRGVIGLAGSGVGIGSGMAATFPLDAVHQRRLAEQAIQDSKANQEALEHWQTLLDLTKGQLSLEDLPAEDQDFYAQELADNAEELKVISRDPYKKKLSFDELKHGEVKPLFEGAEKAKMHKLFPHKVHHPYSKLLPGIGGIAGGIGAEAILNRLSSSENEE